MENFRHITRCRSCRDSRFLNDTEAWSRHIFQRSRVGARNRGLPFSLTPKDILAQYEKQDGKCFYTGLQMTMTLGAGRVTTNASIDRVDSSVGYHPENIVVCCHAINWMKSNTEVGEFLNLCKLVVDHGKL